MTSVVISAGLCAAAKQAAEELLNTAAHAKAGKRTRTDRYLHRAAAERLAETAGTIAPFDSLWRVCLPREEGGWNVVKLQSGAGELSLLQYPEFDAEGHPELALALRVKLAEHHAVLTDYRDRENRPILHRKELLVHPDYPGYGRFAALSEAEERAGLLERAHRAGFRKQWLERLSKHGYAVKDHELVKLEEA